MITLLGATGYTGRLVAAETARQDVPLRLAGRRADALDRLAAQVGADAVAVVDVADPEALRGLAETAAVLVTTVGPYGRFGRAVLEAALRAGCDYVDVSAEVPFLAWAHQQPHVTAAVCPGAGFDGALGDLLAVQAAARLEAPVREARVAYLLRGGRVSAGSVRTMLDLAGQPDGEAFASRFWWAPFPPPLGPRGAVSAPTPEVVSLPRSTGAAMASAYIVVPAPRVVRRLGPALSRLGAVAARTGLWGVLQRTAEHLPEGPTAEQRHATRAAVLAQVRAADGAVQRAWARVRDPYQASAVLAAAVAVQLLERPSPGPGVLTPSQALGAHAVAVLDRLGRWEVV